MKTVTQDMKSGKLRVAEVPPPQLLPAGVLVRVRRSLISLGTERAVIALAKQGPIGKARTRPDLARKVLNKARQEGWWSTYKVVKNLVESPIPLGYSCAGEVIGVGEEAADAFRVGDRVACAGLGHANHAEVDYVPRNLAVRLPPEVGFEEGAFVTVGAIAMQGVRLASLELGETVVVMGLGLVGQVAAQIVRSAGCSVVAFDPDPEKVAMAESLGIGSTARTNEELAALVRDRTHGHGADAVLVCAATKSNQPLRSAAELSRLRGRIVVVGDVGMDIERRPFFEKEVSLVVSRSYGPGRYDPQYEVHGVDYPLPYVRWTQRRNMESFVDLIGSGGVRLEPLVTHRYAIENATDAYRLVTGESKESAVAIILSYDGPTELTSSVPVAPRREGMRPSKGVSIGVIGAGQFAKGVLLPLFAGAPGTSIGAVCTASGMSARHVAERYGARHATSDPDEIFADDDIDAVVIATSHDQHATLATRALRAGKAVFVEKPLALTEDGLAEVMQALRESQGRLMVGFNRRFAPLAVECRAHFPEYGKLQLAYRVNAGTLPSDSWVLDPKVGGGRIIGEVCHFVDFACFMTGSLPVRIHAEELPSPDQTSGDRDALALVLRMANGSLATVHYLSNGDPSLPKEYVEVSGEGRSAVLDNFRKLRLHEGNRTRRRGSLNQRKGHAEEVRAFLRAVTEGGEMPIDACALEAVTQTTFLAHLSLETGSPVEYVSPTAAVDR